MDSTGKTSRKSAAKKTAVSTPKPPEWLGGYGPLIAKGGLGTLIVIFVLNGVDLKSWDRLIRNALEELMKKNGPGPVLLGIVNVGLIILMVVGAVAVFRHMRAEIHRNVDEKKWLQEQLIGRAPSSSSIGGEQ